MVVPFTIMVLGGEIPVPTLDGEEKVKIPAGTPAGKIFKIKGKGLPAVGSPSSRGDEYVRVDIEVPTKLDPKQKALLQEFADLRGEKVQVKEKKGFFDRIKESFE